MVKYDKQVISIVGASALVLLVLISSIIFMIIEDDEVEEGLSSAEEIMEELDKDNNETRDQQDIDKDQELMRLKEIEAAEIKKAIAIKSTNDAGKTGNLGDCDRIEGDEKAKLKCLDNANIAKAGAEHKLEYCEVISDSFMKDRCSDSYYYNEALEKQDSEICNQIQREGVQNICKSKIAIVEIESESFSGDKKDCSELSPNDKDYCINKVNQITDSTAVAKAINEQNISYCNDIVNVALKSSCKDSVNLILSKSKTDASYCYKITKESTKNKCLSFFSKSNDKDTYKNATSENNVGICNQIGDKSLKLKCKDAIYLNLAVSLNDKTKCDSITNAANKELCNNYLK